MTTKKRKSPSNTTKDTSSELKELISKLTSKVEDSINLTAKVAERVDDLELRKLPRVESSEDLVKTAMQKVTKDGDIGESQRVVDFLNPRGQDSGFQPNDVVTVGVKHERSEVYRLNSKGEPAKADEEGEPALGVVLNYMYTRRKDHQRKYKVNFPKFGKSGFLERELILVKAA